MKTVIIKCCDLMVRDWVANQNGSLMQIVAVDEDNAYACEGNEERPWIFGDNEDYKPEPIEITEDILKENKWEVQGYTLLQSEHYYVKDESRNHLLWSHGTLSIWLAYGESNDGVFSDVTLPCKYVHQLQQALRLAGMTDMANNFKV